MHTKLNRRAILAGAASLPVVTIPAFAGDDAELLAIGKEMKALWPSYEKAAAESHEEHERWWELSGLRNIYPETAHQIPWEERERRIEEAIQKTNYRTVRAELNRLEEELHPLCEAALKIEATTLAGFGVLAAAALLTDQYGFASTPDAQRVLARLARFAGFEIEEDDNDFDDPDEVSDAA
jgi:hypothetical protein